MNNVFKSKRKTRVGYVKKEIGNNRTTGKNLYKEKRFRNWWWKYKMVELVYFLGVQLYL